MDADAVARAASAAKRNVGPVSRSSAMSDGRGRVARPWSCRFRERVRRVAGQREFRQEDDGGSQPGGPRDAVVEFGAQGGGVRLPAVLHHADPQRRAAGRFGPGGGGRAVEGGDFDHGYSSETGVT